MRHRSRESGQLLILSLLILLSLGLSLFVVLFLNQYLTKSSVYAMKKQRGIQIGNSALSIATVELGVPSIWDLALNHASFPSGYDGSNHFVATFGEYTIACSTGNSNLSPYDLKVSTSYEVRVMAQSYGVVGGEKRPLRLVEAALGPMTIGARLGSGTAASAALMLAQYPHVGTSEGFGDLTVHWGPIVSYSSMTLHGTTACSAIGCTSADAFGNHPRLFSADAIVPKIYSPTPPPTTDNAFYWGYLGTTMTTLPLGVNTAVYQSSAMTTSLGGASLTGCTTLSGGYCLASGGPAHLTSGFTLSNSTAVIFIQGDAIVDGALALDINALVVTGSMTFSGNVNNGQIFTLRVPPTARLEYPNSTTFPCSTSMTNSDGSGTCTPPNETYIDFRGFLYVQGDLTVNGGHTDGGYPPSRVIAGSVRVGDSPTSGTSALTVTSGNALRIYYDDEINHRVSMSSLILVRNSVIDLPPR